MDTPSSRMPLTIAALVAAVVLGFGLGAAAFTVLGGDGTTVVRRVVVTNGQPAAETTTSISHVYDRASKGVVEIRARATDPFGGTTTTAQGSGFVFDRAGHVVTNQHVVSGADAFAVSLWNGSAYDARLVGADPSTDLAVLKIDAPRASLRPLQLADSDAVSVGDAVLALGSPFGLEGTLTSGIVSALHREMTAPNNFTIMDTIQTDAAINHGNSGGPLLDRRGRVVGVNAQIESESGGSDGVGFAIPANTVRSIVRQIVATGEAAHAYLGIGMADAPNGVAVTRVEPGTPAARAGLRTATGTDVVGGREVPTGGDVVVAFDGARVSSPSELQRAVDAKRPGDEVTLTIVRRGERKTVTVKLATRP